MTINSIICNKHMGFHYISYNLIALESNIFDDTQGISIKVILECTKSEQYALHLETFRLGRSER